MTQITHAKDALQLPGARLSDEENAIVEKMASLINDSIPKQVRRDGFKVNFNNTNTAAQFELNRRIQQAGWVVQCTPRIEKSRFNDEVVHVGYEIICTPSEESIAAADLVLKERLQ